MSAVCSAARSVGEWAREIAGDRDEDDRHQCCPRTAGSRLHLVRELLEAAQTCRRIDVEKVIPLSVNKGRRSRTAGWGL
jgi:hypothetical protein